MPVRVLLVDDDPSFLDAMTDVLSADPAIDVIGATPDPCQALRWLEERSPDVVVLDVRMPGGGPHLAVRLLEARPGVRLLAMSAYDDEQTVVSMLGAGASAFIAKGSLDEDLALCVQRCADGMFFVMARCADHVRRRLARTVSAPEQVSLGRSD